MRTAVHFHLFYPETLPLVAKYLSHLSAFPHNLYITVPQNNAALLAMARDKFPQATIWPVPNRGYDVGPFIYFLQHIQLEDYDLVLKIHTKQIATNRSRCISSIQITNRKWMTTALHALIGSSRIFARNLRRFQQNPNLGMISARYLLLKNPSTFSYLKKPIAAEMERLASPLPSKKAFVAGTMFLMRSHLLKKFQEVYSIEDFLPTDSHVKDRTLAHVLERVFGFYTLAQGYAIKGIDRDWQLEYQRKILPKIRGLNTRINAWFHK